MSTLSARGSVATTYHVSELAQRQNRYNILLKPPLSPVLQGERKYANIDGLVIFMMRTTPSEFELYSQTTTSSTAHINRIACRCPVAQSGRSPGGADHAERLGKGAEGGSDRPGDLTHSITSSALVLNVYFKRRYRNILRS